MPHSFPPTKEQAGHTYNNLCHVSTENLRSSNNYEVQETATSQTDLDDVDDPDETIPKETRQYGEGDISREETNEEYHEVRTDGWKQEVSLHHPGRPAETRMTSDYPLRQPFQEQGSGNLEDDSYNPAISSYSSWCRTGSVSSSYLSSFSTPITRCSRCSAARKSLKCIDSISFWNGIASTNCCRKTWADFYDKLKHVFPHEELSLDKKGYRVMKMMKELLVVKEPLDEIKISKFLRLVIFIGPFRNEEGRCVVLQQLEDLVTNSCVKVKKRKLLQCWFAGPMSRREAEKKLKGQLPGTFLIRMSGTEETEGNYALSLVMANKSPEHFRVKGHPDEALRSRPFSLCLEFRGRRFATLPDLVNNYLRLEKIADDDDVDNAVRCSTVCPHLPFSQIINGYK